MEYSRCVKFDDGMERFSTHIRQKTCALECNGIYFIFNHSIFSSRFGDPSGKTYFGVPNILGGCLLNKKYLKKKPKKTKKTTKMGQKHRNGQKWNNFLCPNGPFFEPTFSNFLKHSGKIG